MLAPIEAVGFKCPVRNRNLGCEDKALIAMPASLFVAGVICGHLTFVGDGHARIAVGAVKVVMFIGHVMVH